MTWLDANLSLSCQLTSISFDSFISIKNGRVVIVLAGKYAGRKAVVVKATEGGADKKFGQALGNCCSYMLFWVMVTWCRLFCSRWYRQISKKGHKIDEQEEDREEIQD